MSNNRNSEYYYKLENPYEHFDHKLGSKIWPSSDPEDSPYDDYICKYCGKKFFIQMCGASWVGEPPFHEQGKKILRKHLMYCKNFNVDNNE